MKIRWHLYRLTLKATKRLHANLQSGLHLKQTFLLHGRFLNYIFDLSAGNYCEFDTFHNDVEADPEGERAELNVAKINDMTNSITKCFAGGHMLRSRFILLLNLLVYEVFVLF